MTTDPNYIQQQEFRDYIRSTASDDSDDVQGAITSASRAVDSFCGRRFYQAVETQWFSANPTKVNHLWLLDLDDMDIATTSGLTINTETDNSGTYPTSWTLNTDFILEPVNQSSNGITGWPYTRVRAIGSKIWPIKFIPWQRDTVQITATYGWPALPEPVKQATKILVAQFYKLADAPLGVAGWGAYGDIKVRDIPQVEKLLLPYQKTSSMGIA